MHFTNVIIQEGIREMNIKNIFISALLLSATVIPAAVHAQSHTEMLPKGNFESWSSKTIKESAILGGKKVNLMNLGAPWESSNVWAKVCGVTKTNVSVYRDTHPGHGSCAKLYTHIVEAKVLGIINIKVLAAGAIYLGEMIQPIRDTKEPMAKQNVGMPFTKHPKAIMFDYKVRIVKGDRIRQNGITKGKTVKGQDMADCVLYLQKRWEDAEGKLYARRIGTTVIRWDKNTDWVENASYPIHYGDITGKSFYNESWGLLKGEDTKYARNSKGKIVPVKEVGWGSPDEKPTHIILQFDSSHGGAYVGSVGNTLWVDNVRLVY